MTKTNYQNEQSKREFFEDLRGAEGFAIVSVKEFAGAIGQWQTFTDNEDFSSFDKAKATAFKDWIRTREAKTASGRLSLPTQYNYLRRLKRFFKWLSERPECRNRNLKSDVNFLRLSKGDTNIARSGTTRTMPTFDEVRKIIESIEIKNEIDMRDRAMICFALITGCRIFAITTLKMKNFDKQKRLIHQNPGDGVHTKNFKTILTTPFPIEWDDPERYFMEWFEYLEKKGFRPNDPIFPATLDSVGYSKYSKELVGNTFWKGTNPARKIFVKRCRNAGMPYFHPHSFRHLVVDIMGSMRLTENEKKAISLNLGHADVGTTFGSYGYGSMNSEEAVKIVQGLKEVQNIQREGTNISPEEKAALERLLKKI